MQIRSIFATTIQKRIEPVVKVADRKPATVQEELRSLVITPQWERYLHQMLQEYSEAWDNEQEQGIGIWINGFFGSGKSLLMKTLGVLLEGGELEGQSVHELFLSRLPQESPERADLQRFLALCQRRVSCTAIGGNVHAHLADSNEPLTLIAFRLFARARGYTDNWPFAWSVEYQLDARGLHEEFRRVASELCGTDWEEIVGDADFNSPQLYQAAATVLPEHFSGPAAVEQAAESARGSGIIPVMLIERMVRWCKEQDRAEKRHKLLFQFDELGQWLQGGSNMTDRIMQVQALVESASTLGEGRIWIAVTAHGDIQALNQSVQQEYYAKINQRFILKCKLSNEDINTVVQERLLRKTVSADGELRRLYQQQVDALYDLGALKETKRVYPSPDAASFASFYPYMPWTVAVIPDVTRGIARAIGRGEELTGSSRTMIGVAQGGILDARELLDSPVGTLISLADLYNQFASDIPIETKTDLNRIHDTVPSAGKLTTRVAQALYLLGQADYISCTLENVVRALVSSLDDTIAAKRSEVKAELDKLVKAGYAKHVGENYLFLSTQERTFQEKVLAKQEELLNRTEDLIQKLREFDGSDALRFDRVTSSALSSRERVLRLVLDGKVLRNTSEHVTVQVYSPLQRIIEPAITNDDELKIRASQNPNVFFLRMENVPELRRALAQVAATEAMVQQSSVGDPDYEVARMAKSHDVAEYQQLVHYYLAQAVRGGVLFFRGTAYYPTDGDSASAVMRNTLAQLLPLIYARYNDLPHRIHDEVRAVRDALNNVTSNSDLQGLKVFKADGTLNDGNPLLSHLRANIPQMGDGMGMASADKLREDLEKPPFGWDSNCVKVGMALLLRASAIRLIENGAVHDNPASPEVFALLTKEQRFKALKAQGVHTELGTKELLVIRGYIDTIFLVKPAVVPSVVNETLKEQLLKLQAQAGQMRSWAATAVCPLPLDFEAGSSMADELLSNNAPNVRLPQFMREWETLHGYVKLLRDLLHFKDEHSNEFVEARGFFNSMVNVEDRPEGVDTFVRSWKTLTNERVVTDPIRWSELIQAYYAARQALADRIQSLQQQAQRELAELQASLHKKVEEAGIPVEHVEQAVGELQEKLRSALEPVERISPSIAEARAMERVVMDSRITLSNILREIRARYQPVDIPPPESQETHMNWRNLLGTRRIASLDDLEQITKTLQSHIYSELEQHHIVIIE